MSLEKIINGCMMNDVNSQKYLYQIYYKDMKKYCFKLVNNKENLEDIIHDAFIIVFTKIKELKDIKKFDFWLKKIFVNEALKKNNAEKRYCLCDSINDYNRQTSINSDSSLLMIELNNEINNLPIKMRMAIIMSMNGYSIKEISKKMQVSEGTIKSNIFDGRKKIKIILNSKF